MQQPTGRAAALRVGLRASGASTTIPCECRVEASGTKAREPGGGRDHQSLLPRDYIVNLTRPSAHLTVLVAFLDVSQNVAVLNSY